MELLELLIIFNVNSELHCILKISNVLLTYSHKNLSPVISNDPSFILRQLSSKGLYVLMSLQYLLFR